VVGHRSAGALEGVRWGGVCCVRIVSLLLVDPTAGRSYSDTVLYLMTLLNYFTGFLICCGAKVFAVAGRAWALGLGVLQLAGILGECMYGYCIICTFLLLVVQYGAALCLQDVHD
jgi:hypothetical protein